jgi:16S rRNA (cytosine1402-N4)-methyltransferase
VKRGRVGVGAVVDAQHTPVMVQEVLDALRVKPQGSYIDCTIGLGGHSLAILGAASPSPRVLGIDLDANALEIARRRLEAYQDRVVLAQGSFAELEAIAGAHGFVPADGVLFDLGLSSLQVDTAGRGFSFQREARLDMRFDPTQRVTAHQVVNRYSEQALADVIFQLGEEHRARRVARAIVASRPIETTTQLADVVARAIGRPRQGRIHPATRTFQAIRMEVNGELDNLERGLEQAIAVLGAGGRLAVISYHSLEDRLVKNLLRREASDCICPPGTPQCVCGHTATLRLVSRKVITPTPAEAQANPRSRSARMRAAERI